MIPYRKESDGLTDDVNWRDQYRLENAITEELRSHLAAADAERATWQQRATSAEAEITRITTQERRVAECLHDFALAYANVDTKGKGGMEVELFRVWLKATGILGLTAMQGTVKQRE